MRVQIAARHCHVPDAVRTRAHELLDRLERYDDRVSSAEVVFEEEKHRRRVEGILSVHGGEPAVAQGTGEDFRTALDQMADRLSRIIRRRRSRIRDHQGPGLREAVGPE